MKAVRYHSYGDSGVLVYEDAGRPVAGSGQVVVKVAGAAFNPVDVAIRAGFMQQVFPLAFPHIPNFDVAGVVAEVVQVVLGQGVEQQATGDEDVAGHDAAEEGPPAVGDRDQGGAVVGEAGAAGDEAGLLQQGGLVGQAAAAVDDAVGQLGHGQLPAGGGEAGQELELHVAEVALGA